jgi:hypothetical protein
MTGRYIPSNVYEDKVSSDDKIKWSPFRDSIFCLPGASMIVEIKMDEPQSRG